MSAPDPARLHPTTRADLTNVVFLANQVRPSSSTSGSSPTTTTSTRTRTRSLGSSWEMIRRAISPLGRTARGTLLELVVLDVKPGELVIHAHGAAAQYSTRVVWREGPMSERTYGRTKPGQPITDTTLRWAATPSP